MSDEALKRESRLFYTPGRNRAAQDPREIPTPESIPAAAEPETRGNEGQILRFHASERDIHWSIAIPFITCYITGMILMLFYGLHSPGFSRGALSWIHRIGGGALILLPILAVIRHRGDYRIHLYNIKQAWSWAFSDVKWLLLMGIAAVNKKVKLPEQGKFNAAEKINFMMVLCTYPLFALTGVLLWLPGSAVLFWMVHVGMAIIATPLMFGHIYMALINPGTRIGLGGMISGYVDREWAKHHYERWYKEKFEKGNNMTGKEK